MPFQLKPAVRQLSLVFPLLLIALPAAIKAAEDRPGPVLPPPSLYDSSGSDQPVTRSTTTQPTAPAAQTAPAQSVPPAASDRAPSVQAAPAQPTAAPATVRAAPPPSQPAAAAAVSKPAPPQKSADTPREPWYKRWFSSTPSSSTPASRQPVVADTSMAKGGLNSGGRGQYAYDSSHTIRTGFGQCVKTGLWSPTGASADCEPTMQRQEAGAKKRQVLAEVTTPSATGSAPVRQITPPKPDVVEVVPLPPKPLAARAELKSAPAKEQLVRDEIITALAATRPTPEPDPEKLTLSAGALFPLSSTSIKPLGREKLDELVSRLKEMDYASVHIVGFTDPTGPSEMNEKLSKRRADAVKQYLAAKGIDPKRIQTEGKGGADPLPKTRDCDALPRMEKIICYAPDRRVEIEVAGNPPRS